MKMIILSHNFAFAKICVQLKIKNRKLMKKTTYLLFVLSLILITSCSSTKNKYLTLDKTSYSPGELITVSFTADTSWDANAWVGIIPAKVKHGTEYENDKYDLVYAYIGKKPSGTFTFSAPLEPGKYDIRMNDTDFGTEDGTVGKEVSSISFEVK